MSKKIDENAVGNWNSLDVEGNLHKMSHSEVVEEDNEAVVEQEDSKKTDLRNVKLKDNLEDSELEENLSVREIFPDAPY